MRTIVDYHTIQEAVSYGWKVVVLLLGFGVVIVLGKVVKIEKAIRSKQSEIDSVTDDIAARTSGHLVTASQQDRMIKVAEAPLRKQLKALERDRRFLLDKLPFLKR